MAAPEEGEPQETDQGSPVEHFQAGEKDLSAITAGPQCSAIGCKVTACVRPFLAHWLAVGPPLQGAHILEVGTGLGCFGLGLAAHGADVLLTDMFRNGREDLPPGEELFRHVLKAIEHNIQRNAEVIASGGGSARAADMTLGDESDQEAVRTMLGDRPLDFIVSCQVLYNAALHEPMLNLLQSLGAPRTRMLCGEFRAGLDVTSFSTLAKERGFSWKEVECAVNPEIVVVEITHVAEA